MGSSSDSCGEPKYVEQFLRPHSEKEETRRRLIEIVGDYESTRSYDELNEEQKIEIDALNLSEMLTDALAEGYSVDYMGGVFRPGPPLGAAGSVKKFV